MPFLSEPARVAVRAFLLAVGEADAAKADLDAAGKALRAAEAVVVRRMRAARSRGASMTQLAVDAGLSRPALYRLDAKFTDVELEVHAKDRPAAAGVVAW